MHVVIDGGSWSNRRGFGRFTREIVGALASHGRHEYSLVVDRSVDQASLPGRLRIIRVGVTVSPSTAASADGWRSPMDMLRVSRALTGAGGDVVFFPCVYTFVPLFTRRPVVTGVHDTIAERYPSLIFPSARSRVFWNAKVAAAVRQSARIVTVSQYASRCVHDELGVPPSRLRAISEAPAAPFRPVHDRAAVEGAMRALSLDPGARTLVYVGGLAPHKNLVRVLRAFGRLARTTGFEDATLVFVGDHAADVFHSSESELRMMASTLPRGRVVFAGAVPDDQLALLLNGARALLLVSLDEGFGLPAIEAAACGTPVIATIASAMPEVLGDAALYVDPLDEGAIGDALVRALTDSSLRSGMAAVALERARALSWRQSAESLDGIFEELIPGAGRSSRGAA